MRIKPYSRSNRYGHELQKLLAEIFLRELDTSNIGLITVTKVLVTKDLKLAKVYLSSLSNQNAPEIIIEYFSKRKKLIRKHLGSQITSKTVPDLRFFYDETFAEAEKIERLFSRIHRSDQDN